MRPREVFHARDDCGRIVDFHSLRYTFITRLTQLGACPGHAQALARHAKLDLTMNVYTDVRSDELRAAVERTLDRQEHGD